MSRRIPQSFIDDLTARIDIVELIDAHVPLRRVGREYVARCPFHDERTPSFTVSPRKQFYHCFGCGAHGTAIGFLMAHGRLDFPDAVRELAERVGLALPEGHGSGSPDGGRRTVLLEVLREAGDWFRRQLREHARRDVAIDYLKGRGLDGETAAAFGIGYAPPGWNNLLSALQPRWRPGDLVAAGLIIARDDGGHYDRFRDRIMFPLRDGRGRIIAFGGRVLGDATPKYLNSPETALFQKGRELYGLYEARQASRELGRLLVVEGYMDVVMLRRFGITSAVATLGTATTPEHMMRLFQVAPDVVFCFDGDRAGRAAAWRALESTLPVLRDGCQAKFMFLPDGADPDSLIRREGREVFEQRVATAVTLSTFFYDALREQADTSTIDGRARLAELARPHLERLPPGLFRRMMFERLAELTRVDAAVLDPTRPGASPRRGGRLPARRVASLPRRALAILLQEPGLAKSFPGGGWLGELAIPGTDVLRHVLDLLHESPHLSTAGVLERCRDHPAGRHLARLAAEESLIPAQALEAEFRGVMSALRARYLEQCIERLRARPLEELSEEEKASLRRLLSEKASVG